MSAIELPRELVWGDDGHLDEIALTALADGQMQIVPADARDHAAQCAQCAAQLGAAALLSMNVGEAVASLPEYGEAAPQRVSAIAAHGSRSSRALRSGRAVAFPLWPIAAALAVAFLGAVPALAAFSTHFAETLHVAVHVMPTVLRTAVLVVQGLFGSSPGAVLLRCISAAFLLVTGFAVTRWLPRGGVGARSLAPAGVATLDNSEQE